MKRMIIGLGALLTVTAASSLVMPSILSDMSTLARLTSFAWATSNSQNQVQVMSKNSGLDPKIIKLALKGYNYAKDHGGVANDKYLTVVDFSQPSKDKRMYVFNMDTNQVAMNLLVANGKNSGLFKATHFSNKSGSLESSLGVFRTGTTYYGHHGRELHIHGLEDGINNNAYRRAVIVHAANYVTPSYADKYGRVGRSWGCFAVNPAKAQTLINKIKGGSVIFAYAPQENDDPNLVSV